ncbi:BIRC2_3 [Mytilus edulis]|uniref:BIRC2_3 n=1 Tax=Mytilus edulis TaxID=6550 RepID=A0A8S3R4L1_MYTED|nr:BIRC2_3 [Mytilus edulis]
MPSLMNNWNTNTDIWSGSSTSNHISNTSLNNGASGSSTTHVDTHKGSNTPMIMANKDQLYISGSSQENYTHTLQNNTGLVSNSMTMTADTTSNQQTLLNTPVELTVRRNSYSQSINIDSPVSTNQLERRQTYQAISSPVNGNEAPLNHVANRPTSFNSKLQLPFKRSAYNNSIDIDVPVSANQSEREQTAYEPEFSHPNFRRFQDRMESYKKWPITAKQPPKILAESGCFYTGKTDIVRCFCCNLGLAEWAETDNPWTEHARHNPKCWFLRREKGQPFIDRIQGEWQKRYKPKNPAFDDVLSRLATFDGWREDIEQTPEDLSDAGFFPQRHEASVNTTNTTEEQGDNQLLATENAKTVLRMGFPINTVKSAINSLIRSRGHSNFSTEDLLEFILNPVESSQTPMRTSNEGRSLSPLKVCTPLHNNTEVGIPELYYIKEMWYDKTPIQQKSLKWCFSNYKSRSVSDLTTHCNQECNYGLNFINEVLLVKINERNALNVN